jgi:hypothetical protein
MKRAAQIAISVLAIILLVHPLDCFSKARTREAMECCLKGKCAPSANADDCCKNTVPSANHFLNAKAADHSAPVIAPVPASTSVPLPAPAGERFGELLRHPPPPLSLTALNLPLLI